MQGKNNNETGIQGLQFGEALKAAAGRGRAGEEVARRACTSLLSTLS